MKSVDLVGRWVEVGNTRGTTAEFHADSTFIHTRFFPSRPGGTRPGVLTSDGMAKVIGSWKLAGDTLVEISQKGIVHTPIGWVDAGPPSPDGATTRLRVARDGKRLTMMSLEPNTPPTVYERDGSSANSQSSMPTLVRPQTLKSADIMGRWIVPGDTLYFAEFHVDMTYTNVFPVRKEVVPSRFRNLLKGPDVPLRLTGLWRVAGDTLTTAVQNAALWTGSTWQDVPPPPLEDNGLRRVRREGKRLFVMSLSPNAIAAFFERDDKPAVPVTAPGIIDSAKPKP